MSTPHTRKALLFCLILFLGLLTACQKAEAEPTPTHTSVPPTETLSPPTDTPTPIPTETLTPTETPTLTETPTATIDLAATAAVEATQEAQVVLEKVGAVLEKVGISPDSGYLAWSEADPFPLIDTDYGSLIYEEIDDGVEYSTYVLHTDVTWESSSGLAGCGVIFHAEKNLEVGKQYQFVALRLSGLPLWDVELWEYGRWQSTTTGKPKVNSAIKQDNGSINNYIFVIKKGVMSIYANDARLSNVIITSAHKGRVAFFVTQESGKTVCEFKNAWIWALEEEE